jgi:perosamine synthetase
MRIGRTMPPAAAPVELEDLYAGLRGLVAPADALRERTEEIRGHFNVRHVFLVSSGTAALTVALRALAALSRRKEVVIPAYTCFSVPAAVIHAGLTPVLCDVNPWTFDFDHAQLTHRVTANTLAVVTHHLFGSPSDVGRIRQICRARGAFVVEDAAQAMGVTSAAGPLGTLGDVGIFSFGRGKNVTCGSGGAVVTNDDRIGRELERTYHMLPPAGAFDALKTLVVLACMAVLIRPWLFWLPSALPFLGLGKTVYPRKVRVARLSDAQAAALEHWETRLGWSNQVRAEMTAIFSRGLPAWLAYRPVRPYLRLPLLASSIEDRARLVATSRQRGLGMSLAYPTPISAIPELRPLFAGQRFPGAQQLAAHLITLPTHHWLSDGDRRAIVECLGAASRAVPGEVRRAS